MKRKCIGHVGVDSGQVMICDPCYIDGGWKKAPEWDNHEDFNALVKEHRGQFNYLGACNVTLSKEQAGQFGMNYSAVVSTSGYGDGAYPVYATKQDGRIMKLEIIFIEEDDDV